MSMVGLILNEEKRIVDGGTYAVYPDGVIMVETVPDGDIYDYLYIDGQFVYDPLPVPEEKPSQMDIIEAQVAYTAMMTNTLLEV